MAAPAILNRPSPTSAVSSTAGAPPALRCEGLTKRFPVERSWRDAMRHPFRREWVTVVNDVTLEVRAGEFFGILGPNGAGKTSLFKLLTAAVLPDSGSATITGFDVVRQPTAVRRALAYVPANERSLNWRLSARENLRVHAALQRLHGRAAEQRIEEVLRIVELGDVGEKMLATFSSGMKQRLSIARAMLAEPRVLLLDEPTRSMDPVSARVFRKFLREDVCERQGRTVILATHSTEEAFGLCDRVAVLDRGRVVATGSADRLMHEFGDESYQLWTTAPSHPAVSALERAGTIADVRRATEGEDGWYRVQFRMPGDLARAAEVLATLVESGMPLARYERVALSLGDLIERVVAATREETPT